MSAAIKPDAARRSFLKSSLAAGVWTLSATALPLQAQRSAPPAPSTSPFDFMLRMGPDGMVTAYTVVTNLGQGTHTVLAQMVAEELDIPLERVRIEHAQVAKRYHLEWPPGITTFGSAGVGTGMRTVRPASAAAREMLVRAAAARWSVEPASCSTADGHVLHSATARKLSYVELREAASLLTPPTKLVFKPSATWTTLGKPAARRDIPARVNGSAVFGIDVKRPGLLVAAVVHAPTFGGTLASVDTKPALAVRGVKQVVQLHNAVAVVAKGYWQAQKAVRLLKPSWRDGPNAGASTASMRKEMLQATAHGTGVVFPQAKLSGVPQDAAATASAIASAVTVIDTTYEVPFLAHAPLEPLNATVAVRADGAEIWLSTQSQTDTQRGVAKALGLTPEQVTVHTQDVGGGFGRRLEHDFAVEAALIAKAVGQPVKTIWSRETDMQSGYYRPMTITRVQLALNAKHEPSAIRGDMAGPSLLEHTGVTNGPMRDNFDWTYTMGWCSPLLYDFRVSDTRWSRVDKGVPCTYWRSVGYSQNCYFVEHTIDQAARTAGQDPLAYRRRLLAGKERGLAFIDALAERARWSEPLPAGHFRGIAVCGSNSTYSGHVVEIAVTEPGKFKLVRITAAIDPGLVFDQRAVEAQMMGGTLFGLSGALFSEITLTNGRIEQGNFDSYQVALMAHAPIVDVLVLSTGRAPFGVGEEGPPSILPAVANALYAASGKVVNRMPVSHSGWQIV
ncbi:MAG: molybdopterin cofactor-binding domain-containing protein [Pseudomonadota bacterium]